MNIKLPNFLFVGAAKSGTSSLFEYLKQHPDVYIPPKKECRFFSEMSEYIKGPKGNGQWDDKIPNNLLEYQSLFSDVSKEQAVGDVSPDYLYFYEKSIKNIKRLLGDKVKIIIILRDPAERAYSHYLHYVRDGQETLSFEEALQQEDFRIKEKWEFGWHYRNVGFYYKQVKAYLANFKDVKIYLLEDLEKDPAGLMKNIFDFLEIDKSFTPIMSTKYNVSGVPKNKFLGYLFLQQNLIKTALKIILRPILSKEKRMKLREHVIAKALKKPAMKPETRRHLQSLYKDDIILLQDLIHRDLSSWLSGLENNLDHALISSCPKSTS